MLLDLFSCDNYINVNMNIAKLFDLNTAVYSSLLLSVYKKAFKKDALIDGRYFKLDRNYVRNKTTLSKESQLLCDVALMSAGLMEKKEEDIIYLDVDEFISKVSDTDRNVIKAIKENMKDDVDKYKTTKRETKKATTVEKFAEFIYYDNQELHSHIREWITSIVRKYGAVSMNKNLILEFEHKLDSYTKGDLDLALKLIDIAITMGYKDLQWAINNYEASNRAKNRQPNTNIRTTTQTVATRSTINTNIVF